ncbi:MAG: hypothetical protein H7839_08135 [Magnetococcus sp. YQC-5]
MNHHHDQRTTKLRNLLFGSRRSRALYHQIMFAAKQDSSGGSVPGKGSVDEATEINDRLAAETTHIKRDQ